ncbi:hypothetical protein [Aquimarina intermedia]|uniref:Uncharacterized protein n=1 Tax=Aquimarina intermedia TaxID=350814 RepID=A0A5S5C4D6_9FLAO|nr:hypothetical protein [Aquimarina intermedia]TYP74204.1 hypothetical protein BD809_10419 [Aquimarina intermedia]
MTKQQINKLDMYQAVQTYLDTNTKKWSAIPKLLEFKNELDQLLINLHEDSKNQEGAKLYLGSNKVAQKRIVAEKADILNDILEAYAAIEEKKGLEQKAAKSFSELYKLRNQDFILVINETISLLEVHLKALAIYGVTAEQITDLKTSLDGFLELHGQPRQYRIESKQATMSLSELFDQLTELLTNKLDKILKSFKRTDSNFYNGYEAARIIVNV